MTKVSDVQNCGPVGSGIHYHVNDKWDLKGRPEGIIHVLTSQSSVTWRKILQTHTVHSW